MDENKKTNKFSELINFAERKVKEFDAFDFVFFKFTDMAIGLLIGSFFSKKIRKISAFIALFAGFGTFVFIVKTFFKHSTPYFKIR